MDIVLAQTTQPPRTIVRKKLRNLLKLRLNTTLKNSSIIYLMIQITQK